MVFSLLIWSAVSFGCRRDDERAKQNGGCCESTR